ncbi:uncharacterized protein LOC128293779 [Gossypium arboreum]|uniref:uncharacterized protein LOC128293779 n=1 Tax=Gossypium arboreum TaxID=29729 RepID=UPI0022F1D504|nr:uncharacterized protein LOC128293779 [Gossypium arboreum]
MNLRRRKRVELLKDYDCTIEYHSGKVNMVADALSRKAMTDQRTMFARLSLFDDGIFLVELQVKPTWIETCVLNDPDLRQSILSEAYSIPYAMYPSGNKMYRDHQELCLTCQQVKVEHQLPLGLLQSIKISLWKWERVMMDFKLKKVYISEIVRLHPVPVSIIFDKDLRVTSLFWKKLYEALGSSWEDYLPLVEFAYNNSYQSSTQVAPYEALYGRKCCTLLCWTELGKQCVLGPELVSKIEDKVSQWKKILRFGHKGKLSPRFIRPYRILKREGLVAYQLELPSELDRIHDMFHISMLRRYHFDPTHIVPIEEIEVRPDLTFEEEPIQILDRDVKVLRKKSIHLLEVLWQNYSTEMATWEPEDNSPTGLVVKMCVDVLEVLNSNPCSSQQIARNEAIILQNRNQKVWSVGLQQRQKRTRCVLNCIENEVSTKAKNLIVGATLLDHDVEVLEAICANVGKFVVVSPRCCRIVERNTAQSDEDGQKLQILKQPHELVGGSVVAVMVGPPER